MSIAEEVRKFSALSMFELVFWDTHKSIQKSFFFRDTLDVVKQSAALCLLRLFRTDASVIPSGKQCLTIID